MHHNHTHGSNNRLGSVSPKQLVCTPLVIKCSICSYLRTMAPKSKASGSSGSTGTVVLGHMLSSCS